MHGSFKRHLTDQLNAIRTAGLYKNERMMTTPQGAHVGISPALKLLNMCSNNYLGLAHHPEIQAAARRGLEQWGYGMASVRFICGTQEIHKKLEDKLSEFLGTEDTILYSSCFDANGGLFETLLTEADAIISDELNHASIIDGIRLSKAKRYRFKNSDMKDLERQLEAASRDGARFKLITTDGVFSMDGNIALLDRICELADRYDALVHFDDSHGTGVVGETGRGTHEFRACDKRIDIVTGTLGKALGGASGGYTSGRNEIIMLLRQRSRPYLFSNTIAPPVVAGALRAIELLSESDDLRARLRMNTRRFRQGMIERGFDILPGEHPIVPIMMYDAKKAAAFADAMLRRGIYLAAFSYPVVPHDKARIRVQLSAAHTDEDVDFAVDAFAHVKAELEA